MGGRLGWFLAKRVRTGRGREWNDRALEKLGLTLAEVEIQRSYQAYKRTLVRTDLSR